MQIKKYEAVDMPSAVKMIKSDLGSDAVILSTRTIRKGDRVFGLFGRAMLEVTAAVDWAAATSDDTPPGAGRPPGQGNFRGPAMDELPSWFYPLKEDINEIRDSMARLQSWEGQGPGERRLLQELSDIKTAVEASLKQTEEGAASETPALLTQLKQRLVLNDVAEETVDSLLARIGNGLPESLLVSSKKLEAMVRAILTHIFRVQGGLGQWDEGPKKVALIGSTGAGKTTTIAKLAAAYALTHKKKVALVTIDTYRIAAIEQLRIYAGIIGIPVDVVVQQADLDRTFEKHQDKDLILIDTAGRSHRNLAQMRELATILGPDRDVEKHLVLSATTKWADMLSMLETYRPVGYSYLLFSKIDEGNSHGTILDAVLQSGKAVSYLTDGQRVPEDLREAAVKDLVDLVLLQGFLADEADRRGSEELEKEAACSR